MSRLNAKAEGTTRAEPDIVWELVADANRYPEWGPWNDGGYRPPAAGPSRARGGRSPLGVRGRPSSSKPA